MAVSTTTYDINVVYKLNDRASKALAGIERKATTAARSTSQLGSSFAKMAGIAAGAFGLKKAIGATIGFNRSLEKTQAQLRTIIQLNTGRDFAQSTQESSKLLSQFRNDAKQTAGTFQDMSKFAANIAGPVTRAGGSLQDLREITKGAVVASAAFGEDAELASRDIQQALAGTLGNKDRFARAVLEPLKITAKQFNKLGQSKRLDVLKEAFDQKAIKDAAKAYQNSFEGTFSTFKSSLQEFGGNVGSRLFKSLNKSLQQVNKWFSQNQAKVDKFADTLATGIRDAFIVVKDAFAFVFRNRELLMTMAKAVLALKAGSVLGKGLAGLGVLNSQAASAGRGLGGVVNKLGKASAILGVVAVASQHVARLVDRKQERGIKRTAGLARVRQLSEEFDRQVTARDIQGAAARGFAPSEAGVRESQAVTLHRKFSKLGLIKNGQVNNEAIQKQFSNTRSFDALRRGIFDDLPRQFGGKGPVNTETEAERIARQVKNVLAQQGKVDSNNMARTLSDQANRLIAMAEKQGLDQNRMLMNFINRTVQGGFAGAIAGVGARAILDGTSTSGRNRPRAGGTSIGKMVIEVKSDDPDRFAMGLESVFADLTKSGAQAANALRGG